MLITKKKVNHVFFTTPNGEKLFLEVLDISINKNSVSCAIKKQSGKDPDITNGILIYAKVELTANNKIEIDGGVGVGRVTLPGLDQKVGNAAINSVPRLMIEEAVKKELNGTCGAKVTIFIPEGVELAKKTFNSRLGIVGGLSILGTTGIVKPMSDSAMLGTMQAEINIRKALKISVLLMTPGNYGKEFIKKKYNIASEEAVLCSNYVADCIKIAVKTGFTKILFIGHIGKLIKASGGMENTHSKYGDNRIKTLYNIAIKYCPIEKKEYLKKELFLCVSCDEAIKVLDTLGIKERVLKKSVEILRYNMILWASKNIQCEVIMFSNAYGILAESDGASELLKEYREPRKTPFQKVFRGSSEL